MKRSIYYRNFFTMISVVLLSFVLLGGMFMTFSRSIILQEKRRAMAQTSDEVVRGAESLSTEVSLSSLELKMIISISSNASGYQVMLTDPDGVIINCSDREMRCDHLGMQVPDNIMSSFTEKGTFSGNSDLNGLYPEEKYVVGRAMRSPETQETIGYAILTSDTASMAVIWRQASGTFMFIAVCVLLLTSVISLVMSKKQAEPLNEMSEAVDRFARGDFSVRVDEETRVDEIGHLAHAFNSMADALETSENRRREFIANVSHELKTPMTTISGFADGLLDGTIPKERQNQYLSVISSETRRLSRLVRSMLNMSQLQSMDTSEILHHTFNISDVICETLLGLEGRITSHGLDVNAELPEESISVRGDKDAITQVVYNLMDNATKFAKEGSVLGVKLYKEGSRAFVSIENEGQEIPKDELPLIFDRFHKADKSRSSDRDGVGLGLYIVKTILDNHNEDIYVTSEGGVTKFVFTLTIVQDKKPRQVG